ncbi:MAG: UvrB/UvrC motif-containing protein, partial [Verrucomicrobiota bacterium]|nr:UvrB/UvrC motif-containing protein [Verrucomicrobiota bacterium]
ARHINGECVLFCDEVTDSIQRLIDVTEYRRGRQKEYNERHNITPQSVVRAVQKSLHQYQDDRSRAEKLNRSLVAEEASLYDAVNVLSELEQEMQEAATRLEFERAAHLRDQIKELKKRAGLEKGASRPGKEKEAFRKK